MKKQLHTFLKLTSFELDRLFKFLVALLGITFIANLVGYIYVPMQYINRANEYITQENATTQQVLNSFGTFSFSTVLNSVWIMGPIALGISGFFFYSVFIWYREWFGKNTFAYRLLTLPIPRMQIYFSKLIVLFIGILSLISIQLISLFIGNEIVTAIIPSEWLSSMTFLEAVNSQPLFQYILPLDSGFFLAINGIGLVVLLVFFTIILMERSFKIKGIVLGVIYGITSLFMALFPLFIGDIANNHFILYDSELIIIEFFMLVVIGIMSIALSRYLLKNRITI